MKEKDKNKVEQQITLDLLYSPETLRNLEEEQKMSTEEAEKNYHKEQENEKRKK